MSNKKEQTTHQYILPDGTIVESQKEACELLGIGKNAFRNRVKSGIIRKTQLHKPNGHGQTKEDIQNQS